MPLYVNQWTTGIEDLTPLAHRIKALVDAGDRVGAKALLPKERPYPLDPELARFIGASDP